MMQDQITKAVNSAAPKTPNSEIELTKPRFDDAKLLEIVHEMENRRKNWMKDYKTKLDLNDVLEIRNPQSVIEFIPEIIENMRKEELIHMYPENFLD
jgi:hypothetical protein